MPLAQLSSSFQSLPLLHTSKLGASAADSWVGGFVHGLGPCEPLQQTLLWGWEFFPTTATPADFYSQRAWGFISLAGVWVAQSLLLPNCSSQFICMHVWDHSACLPPPCLPQSTSHCAVLLDHQPPPWLQVSAPPTTLDECFFFNSLVVGFPYSSIFWLFWLFFVFKFVAVLLFVGRGGKHIYLHLHLSQK